MVFARAKVGQLDMYLGSWDRVGSPGVTSPLKQYTFVDWSATRESPTIFRKIAIFGPQVWCAMSVA